MNKKNLILIIIFIFAIFLISCNDDKTIEKEKEPEIELEDDFIIPEGEFKVNDVIFEENGENLPTTYLISIHDKYNDNLYPSFKKTYLFDFRMESNMRMEYDYQDEYNDFLYLNIKISIYGKITDSYELKQYLMDFKVIYDISLHEYDESENILDSFGTIKLEMNNLLDNGLLYSTYKIVSNFQKDNLIGTYESFNFENFEDELKIKVNIDDLIKEIDLEDKITFDESISRNLMEEFCEIYEKPNSKIKKSNDYIFYTIANFDAFNMILNERTVKIKFDEETLLLNYYSTSDFYKDLSEEIKLSIQKIFYFDKINIKYNLTFKAKNQHFDKIIIENEELYQEKDVKEVFNFLNFIK